MELQLTKTENITKKTETYDVLRLCLNKQQMEIKLKKTKSITKKIETYDVLPTVTMTRTYENGELLEVKMKSNDKALPEKAKKCLPLVVKPEFWEFIQYLTPFISGGSSKWKGKPMEKLWDRLCAHEAEEVDFASVEEKDIVLLNNGSHLIFDSKGELIPIPYWGNYLEGNLDSDSYDLPKLLEYLMDRDDVVKDFSQFDFNWRSWEKGFNEIKEVPHYNQNESNDLMHIDVIVIPDAKWLNDTYEKLNYNSTALKSAVFGGVWAKDTPSYLGIEQFRLKKED